MDRWRSLKRTVKEHTRNGAWLAGAPILSLLGVIAMVRGVILVLPGALSHDVRSSLLGWAMLGFGMAETMCTIHVSYRLFAGCCVIGALKLFILLAAEMVSASTRYPMLLLVVAVFFCALFVWFAVRVEGKQFTLLDRFAATFAPLLMYWASRSGQSALVITIELALALTLLLLAGLAPHRSLPSDSKWLMT